MELSTSVKTMHHAVAGDLHLTGEALHLPGDSGRTLITTGLSMNTRRIGAIASGPIIALGAMRSLVDRGVVLACAVLTAAALVAVRVVGRAHRRDRVSLARG